MMAIITVSEQIYQALLAVAEQRGESPEAIIAAALDALCEFEQQPLTTEPMTAEEFAAALGMTTEDVTRADAEARHQHPEAFEHP